MIDAGIFFDLRDREPGVKGKTLQISKANLPLMGASGSLNMASVT